jgi:hypothetical protein
MRNNTFAANLDPEDEFMLYSFKNTHSLWVGNVILHEMNNKQLLDLGMKIQSVVNQIDRENRAVADDRRDEEFRKGDPGHPDNEMGM